MDDSRITADRIAADRTAARIEELDQQIQAFVPEDDRRGRLMAEFAAVPGEGPLAGVAVGVKDIINADGLATRAGSEVPAEVFDGPEASLVARLRAAGAVVAGKTVTAEFAAVAPGETRNPHDLAHTPGGSSSGSAAAVAAGMVPLAIGTQTLGSVIRPAAYCGVVGFKPTYGRIPVDGVIPNAASLDTIGVFAPDVVGVGRAAGVLCDGWRAGEAGGGTRPVLGVPEGAYLEQAEEEGLAAFEGHLELLRAAGYDVRRVPVMADFAAIVEQVRIANRYELAQAHADWFARHGDRYRAETAQAIAEGQAVSRADYEAALTDRATTRSRLAAAMDDSGIDAWVAPPATGPAPHGIATTGSPVMCLPWSNVGVPALTLPAGRAANELPLGLQVLAHRDADEELLVWGSELEKVLAAA
ncbi:amidase [Streptomyces boninensis]|uniref:amidase n=1 Tax=Streptomyces boninensis TaxID=2039455 RepID=UPI003B228F2F